MKPTSGSHEHEKNPKSKDPKGNEALRSKGKEKVIDDDVEEEEGEGEKLKRKSCDAQIDGNLRIAKEAKARVREAREARVTLETQKLLFPSLSMERILNEVGDNPNVYWLEPIVSFDLENSLDSQLDLPITPKAFQFCSFDKIANSPLPDHDVHQMDVEIATVLRKKPKEPPKDLDKMKLG
ncbi:hypothetical protein Lser_V15G06497 [Lactuca serriola]